LVGGTARSPKCRQSPGSSLRNACRRETQARGSTLSKNLSDHFAILTQDVTMANRPGGHGKAALPQSKRLGQR
jgi:hypothetical protein